MGRDGEAQASRATRRDPPRHGHHGGPGHHGRRGTWPSRKTGWPSLTPSQGVTVTVSQCPKAALRERSLLPSRRPGRPRGLAPRPSLCPRGFAPVTVLHPPSSLLVAVGRINRGDIVHGPLRPIIAIVGGNVTSRDCRRPCSGFRRGRRVHKAAASAENDTWRERTVAGPRPPQCGDVSLKYIY